MTNTEVVQQTTSLGSKIVGNLEKVSKTVGKHSPLLLTVAGVVGLGATAVLSYKAAKKVEVIVEEIEDRRTEEERITELRMVAEPLTEEENQELQVLTHSYLPVDRVEVGKQLIGAVALPVTTGLASIVVIGLSYHIQNNRILNLAAALATATAERTFYHNKYKEVHGDEAYNQFTTPTRTTTTQVTDDKGKVKDVAAETKVDIPSIHGEWYDKSSEYSKDDHEYNMAYIKSMEDNLQLRFFRKGFLLMNEVNEALGLPRSRAGALLGWSTSTGFNLFPEITHVLNKETGEVGPQIYVKWTQPKYIYETVEFEASTRGII